MLLDPLALIRRQNGEIGCTRNKRATPDDCESVTRRLAHGEDTGNAQSAKQSNVDQIRTHCTLASLTGQQAGAVQPPDAENRMSGGVEGRGAKSPLPHPIIRGTGTGAGAGAGAGAGSTLKRVLVRPAWARTILSSCEAEDSLSDNKSSERQAGVREGIRRRKPWQRYDRRYTNGQ